MSRVPGSSQEDQDGQDVLPAVHESLQSLASLRHRHVDTVTRLERGQSLRNTDAEGLLMRINETKDSLQRLELGLEEGGLVIALTEYEQQLEQDQVQREVELLKIKDENDWLREELEETERRLEDVLSTIAALEIDKQHHHFIQETKVSEQEADIKPVVPSKIPVGSFRVEEEKRINRALSRDRSGRTKMIRERSMSRIPVFSHRSSYHEPEESLPEGRGRRRFPDNSGGIATR